MEVDIIHKYLFNIPATTGTQSYTYNFKSNELRKYLSGIACPLTTALPTADDIKIELRDDYKSILSFSPVQNWCKNTASVSYDLTQIFRPLFVESAGKNFYITVKVTNSTTAFSFVTLFRQTNTPYNIDIFGYEVKNYDMQSFTVPAPALGSNFNITLPSDYEAVVGINVVGGCQAEFFNLCLDINDNYNILLDPVPLSILKVTENMKTDNAFYPVCFKSSNKQINVRLTTLETPAAYTADAYTITFLLINQKK